MKILDGLQYSKEHVWVKFTGTGSALIGLTDTAQDSIGEIVSLSLPDVGSKITVDESMGDAESAKTVSDILSPVSAIVSQVNTALTDIPEAINEDPYESWVIAVTDISATAALMSAEEYRAFCDEAE